MSDLTAIRAEVRRVADVRASNKLLLERLVVMISALPADQAEIAALAAELKANIDGIADDVVANTPAQ